MGQIRKSRKLLGCACLGALGIGVLVLSLSLASSGPPRNAAEAATATFYPGGALSSPFQYNDGSVTFSAPPGDFASLAVDSNGVAVTNSTIISDFDQSASPFVDAAANASWGPPTIYQASFTDLDQGPINTSTGVITPSNDNQPVWIVTFQSIHSPLYLNTGPAASNGAATSSTAGAVTTDTGDAYAVFTPSGQLIESMLFPTAQRG